MLLSAQDRGELRFQRGVESVGGGYVPGGWGGSGVVRSTCSGPSSASRSEVRMPAESSLNQGQGRSSPFLNVTVHDADTFIGAFIA